MIQVFRVHMVIDVYKMEVVVVVAYALAIHIINESNILWIIAIGCYKRVQVHITFHMSHYPVPTYDIIHIIPIQRYHIQYQIHLI